MVTYLIFWLSRYSFNFLTGMADPFQSRNLFQFIGFQASGDKLYQRGRCAKREFYSARGRDAARPARWKRALRSAAISGCKLQFEIDESDFRAVPGAVSGHKSAIVKRSLSYYIPPRVAFDQTGTTGVMRCPVAAAGGLDRQSLAHGASAGGVKQAGRFPVIWSSEL